MKLYLVAFNLLCLLTIFFWAFYKAHTSEKFINRLSYAGMGFATVIIFLSHLVPWDSNALYQNYVWQRLVFNSLWAFRCLVEFNCEYGSIKWKEAFTNSKQKFLHFTH